MNDNIKDRRIGGQTKYRSKGVELCQDRGRQDLNVFLVQQNLIGMRQSESTKTMENTHQRHLRPFDRLKTR